MRLAAALFALTAIVAPISAPASTPAVMAGMASHGRFTGAPDLVLTSSMIAAGGGAATFSSARLLAMLTAQHRDAELSRLAARYGSARVTQFTKTFDAFVNLALRDAARNHIALPAPQFALMRDPYVLSSSLRRSGVMPDGRYDVGYMIEHLLSRPMHVRLMRAVDADPATGPGVNADFHVILSGAMDDLKTLYQLPQ